MPEAESRKFDQLATAASIVAPLLAWTAYLWERFAGVTFVLSRNAQQIGSVSSAAHQSRTLQLALVFTLLAAGYRGLRALSARNAR